MIPLALKNASTIFLVRLAWTLALMGPGWLFGSHCFGCCFVSGVWKDTADSSIVTMLSSIAIDCCWTAPKTAGRSTPSPDFGLNSKAQAPTWQTSLQAQGLCRQYGMDSLKRHTIGQSNVFQGHTPVFFYGSGDRDHDIGNPCSLFRIEMPLINGGFTSFNLL